MFFYKKQMADLPQTIEKVTRPAKIFTCVICKAVSSGYGNNSEPVAVGRCCDKCNMDFVVQVRVAADKCYDACKCCDACNMNVAIQVHVLSDPSPSITQKNDS